MALSVFDLFSIGIGPSSSHTVGPMRAAVMFAERMEREGVLERTHRIHAQLYGSLGATGVGHGSDKAVLLGLSGERPEICDPRAVEGTLEVIRREKRLPLLGKHDIAFDEDTDLVLHRRKSLPVHPNGMSFTAYDAAKGGVEAFTRALALDLAPYNVRVNGVVPGFINTYGLTEADLEERAKVVPLGRYGTADDLTGAATFLASDDASYITGQFIVVDGGVLVQQRSANVDTFPLSNFPDVPAEN